MTSAIQETVAVDRRMARRALVAFLFGAVLTCIYPIAAAEPVRQIKWGDLVPQLEKFTDPFVDLTPEQKVDLLVVAKTRQLQSEAVNITPEQRERLTVALKRLESDRIDIDGLLAMRKEIAAKRRHAAEAVNQNLNGQRIRLPGYVLPLGVGGRKITDFLLVPYVGACIHEPVPPANQIVRVKFDRGFEVDGQFTPVWVQGVMTTEMANSQLFFVDGAASIPSGYTLDAGSIELYKK